MCATDGLVGIERLFELIGDKELATDVCAFHAKVIVGEHRGPFGGGAIVQAGKFDTVIPHFRNRFEGVGEVILAIFVDGVELNGDGCFHI